MQACIHQQPISRSVDHPGRSLVVVGNRYVTSVREALPDDIFL